MTSASAFVWICSIKCANPEMDNEVLKKHMMDMLRFIIEKQKNRRVEKAFRGNLNGILTEGFFAANTVKVSLLDESLRLRLKKSINLLTIIAISDKLIV